MMKHELPKLGYYYDALEPYIDEMTMEIHHSKHHQAYVNGLNAALENYPEGQEMTVEELLKNLDKIPVSVRTAITNHGGGHFNHSFFWETLNLNGRKFPDGVLAQKIDEAFGSFESFKDKFGQAAISRFGSGWAWLVIDHEGKLEVLSTANQDSPISDGKTPLLGLDVWEHAYYLKYTNKRVDYITNWWHVIDWTVVESRAANAFR